jgi:GT2 family glycosyltransferase
VIPARDGDASLQQSIDNLVARTGYRNFELIIVDHGLREPAELRVLERLAASGRATVLPCSGPANYATRCNLGAAKASGMVVVFLESDIEPIDTRWLQELLGHVLQPDVGLVGALLLSPNDTIAHAGVVLGVNGTSDRPYRGYRRGYGAVAGRALAAQDVTALDTACAAVRRDRYLEVGGMDESLAVSHHDLDLCLRLVERGYRNVWTPHAELRCRHHGTRNQEGSAERVAQAAEEAKSFRARWGARLEADPFYNPNLACKGRPFTLAYPPRTQSWVPPRHAR